MTAKINQTTLALVRGDITRERVDAIANTANEGLMSGGGVDGAIHRAEGLAIAAECSAIRAKQGGCPTGQAVITTGGIFPRSTSSTPWGRSGGVETLVNPNFLLAAIGKAYDSQWSTTSRRLHFHPLAPACMVTPSRRRRSLRSMQ